MSAYRIEERGNRALVVFAEYADDRRTEADEQALQKLMRTKERVVIDLSECKQVATPWLRLITKLSIDADQAGRLVLVAGASSTTLSSADYLGQKKHLHLFNTVDEAMA